MNPNSVYGTCQIISDPDLLGGFGRGAHLQGIWWMLKSGYFTPGTVMMVQGKRYLVLGESGKPQKLAARR